MQDLARIGFEVDTRQVVQAEKDLDNLAPATAKAETATDKINKKFEQMEKALQKANASTGAYKTKLAGLQTQIRTQEKEIANLNKRLVEAESQLAKTGQETTRLGGFFANVTERFNKFATGLQNGFRGLLGSVSQFAMGFGSAFGAIAAYFSGREILSTLSNFEHSMASVQAVTRATEEDMKAMRDMAKQLGATTEFSASQAAEGLRFLGMAGFNTRDALAAIPAVLDLSTAAAMDLGAAADISSNMMSAFGIAASDAGHVADVLAAAASRANTDIYQMGDGMKYVGPVAAALGVSINDTAAAIGTLSNAGLQGSMAGTGLRKAFSSLLNVTPAAQKQIKAMGLDIKDLSPTTNELVDIIDRLGEAGLGTAEALTIFGDRGGPAILALVEQRQGLRDLTNTLRDVDGEAARMAKTMRDNLKGDLDTVKAAIEAVIISMGEAGLTAVLRGVMQTVALLMTGISKLVDAFGWLIGVVGDVVSALASPIWNLVVDNVNLLTSAVLGLAGAYAASFIPAVLRAAAALSVQFVTAVIAAYTNLGIWIAGVVIANGGLTGMAVAALRAAAALVTLRTALIRTGFGAIAVAIGAVIAKILEMKDEVGGLGNAFKILGQSVPLVFAAIGKSAGVIPPLLNAVWAKAKQEFYKFVNDLAWKWADFLTMFKAGLEMMGADNLANSVAGAIETANRVGNDALKDASAAGEEVSGNLSKAADIANFAMDELSMGFDQLKTNARLADMGLTDLSTTIPGATGAAAELDETIDELDDSLDSAGGAAKKAAEALTELQKLAEEFNKLSEPFNQATAAFRALEVAKDNGIISNDQFVASLERIEKAFLATGGTAEQWALIVNGATESVAKKLEDLGKNSLDSLGQNFADLAVDGKANFADLTKSIIKDLLAIAWQAMVVKPLLSWLGFEKGGAFGGGATLSAFAKGDHFGGGATPFANGGAFTNSVVNSPTPFKFAKGGGFGLGVMGEAGPEAILPLTRGPDGSLGVQMYGGDSRGTGGPQDGAGGVVEVRLITDPSPLFTQYVQDVSQDTAVKVTLEAVNEMNDQLPQRVAEINEDSRVR